MHPEKTLPLLLGLLASLAGSTAAAAERGANTLPLAQGWALQSSAQVKDAGEVVSTPAFKAEGWYPITVPSTVVAGLVANKVYPDPYFGMNIRNYPGMSYPMGKNFSKYPMAAYEPVRRALVVPDVVQDPGRVEGPQRVAALPGHQLPGEHLAERPADQQARRDRRRPADLRSQRRPRR